MVKKTFHRATMIENVTKYSNVEFYDEVTYRVINYTILGITVFSTKHEISRKRKESLI